MHESTLKSLNTRKRHFERSEESSLGAVSGFFASLLMTSFYECNNNVILNLFQNPKTARSGRTASEVDAETSSA